MKKIFLQLLQDIRAYKMRFLLVIFGVAWGTITIVLLMGFGAGLMRQVQKGQEGMGKNIVILWGGQTSIPFKGLGIGRRISFRVEDVDLLKKRVREISTISPEYIRWGITTKYGDNLRETRANGVAPSYGEMRTLKAESGRFINKLDVAFRRRVVFLGDEAKARLLGAEDAVGKRILVSGIPFTVIGVLEKKIQNSAYSGMDNDAIFIPHSTFKTIYGYRYLNNIVYRPAVPENYLEVQDEVYKVLGDKFKFSPEDKEALSFWDLNEMEKVMEKIAIGIEAFLAIVGAMTLLIAGASVANIMYFIVDERIKEIGIRRSVGATGYDILTQFLSESLILSAIGGGIGLAISFFIIGLCSFIPETGIFEFIGKPIMSAEIPIVTFIILLVISVAAGYFPARKASKLNPVECLRYE